MRRLSKVVLIAVLAFALGAPADARGVPLKGAEIDNSRPVVGLTGNCVCDDQWYTFGANPGRLRVVAQLHSVGQTYISAWGIRVFLFRGNTPVTWGQTTCPASKKTCGSTVNLSTRVQHRAVYYVKIQGSGAASEQYLLRVLGGIAPLHCRVTC